MNILCLKLSSLLDMCPFPMDYKDNKLNYLNGNELLKILLFARDNRDNLNQKYAHRH